MWFHIPVAGHRRNGHLITGAFVQADGFIAAGMALIDFAERDQSILDLDILLDEPMEMVDLPFDGGPRPSGHILFEEQFTH